MCKKVIVIDDDELFRTGLTHLIDSFNDFEVGLNIGSKYFIDQIVNKKILDDYDLVLLSPPLISSLGIEICGICVRTFSPAPVMIFSNFFSKYTIMKSLECGVSAYYTKRISPMDLEDIMLELTSKKNFSDIKLEPKIRATLINEKMDDITFSEAEREVLKLVCEQKSSAEISSDLGISIRTVESRKRNMMQKTESKNMIGVVMIFMKSKQSQLLNPQGPGELS